MRLEGRDIEGYEDVDLFDPREYWTLEEVAERLSPLADANDLRTAMREGAFHNYDVVETVEYSRSGARQMRRHFVLPEHLPVVRRVMERRDRRLRRSFVSLYGRSIVQGLRERLENTVALERALSQIEDRIGIIDTVAEDFLFNDVFALLQRATRSDRHPEIVDRCLMILFAMRTPQVISSLRRRMGNRGRGRLWDCYMVLRIVKRDSAFSGNWENALVWGMRSDYPIFAGVCAQAAFARNKEHFIPERENRLYRIVEEEVAEICLLPSSLLGDGAPEGLKVRLFRGCLHAEPWRRCFVNIASLSYENILLRRTAGFLCVCLCGRV